MLRAGTKSGAIMDLHLRKLSNRVVIVTSGPNILLRSNLTIPLANKLFTDTYSEGWNIYCKRIAVSLSAQRMHVSNTCNTEFHLFIILGDESIYLVGLCLQVNTFRFIIKGFVL